MSQYKNILIVRTDRIGDVVLTTSILHPLREFFPEAKISMLVSPLTRDLIESNNYLSEVIVDDRKNQHHGFFGFLKIVQSLKKRKFDLAVILHTKKRTNLLCYLAGIPKRIGYKNNKFGFLLTDPLEDLRHLGLKHETEYCLDVIKYLGVTAAPGPLKVSLSDDAERWAEDLINSHKRGRDTKFVAIHLGASDPAKCWSAESFIEVIQSLQQKYAVCVLLVGAQNTMSSAADVLSKVKNNIADLTGKTRVSQLTSLLKRCDLLISNDSGPVHIADALGIAVISIFTRNQPGINPQRWQPLGAKARTVSVDPTDHLSFKKAGSSPVKYFQLIKPQQVLEEVDALFKLC